MSSLYQMAKTARENKDYKTASVYYSQLMLERPQEWEGLYYSAYCMLMQTNISHMLDDIDNMSRILPSVIDKIRRADETDTEKQGGVAEVVTSTLDLTDNLFYETVSYESHLDTAHWNTKEARAQNERVAAIASMNFQLGNLVERQFSENPEIAGIAAAVWEQGLTQLFNYPPLRETTNEVIYGNYGDKIRNYFPEYRSGFEKTEEELLQEAEAAALEEAAEEAVREMNSEIVPEEASEEPDEPKMSLEEQLATALALGEALRAEEEAKASAELLVSPAEEEAEYKPLTDEASVTEAAVTETAAEEETDPGYTMDPAEEQQTHEPEPAAEEAAAEEEPAVVTEPMIPAEDTADEQAVSAEEPLFVDSTVLWPAEEPADEAVSGELAAEAEETAVAEATPAAEETAAAEEPPAAEETAVPEEETAAEEKPAEEAVEEAIPAEEPAEEAVPEERTPEVLPEAEAAEEAETAAEAEASELPIEAEEAAEPEAESVIPEGPLFIEPEYVPTKEEAPELPEQLIFIPRNIPTQPDPEEQPEENAPADAADDAPEAVPEVEEEENKKAGEALTEPSELPVIALTDLLAEEEEKQSSDGPKDLSEKPEEEEEEKDHKKPGCAVILLLLLLLLLLGLGVGYFLKNRGGADPGTSTENTSPSETVKTPEETTAEEPTTQEPTTEEPTTEEPTTEEPTTEEPTTEEPTTEEPTTRPIPAQPDRVPKKAESSQYILAEAAGSKIVLVCYEKNSDGYWEEQLRINGVTGKNGVTLNKVRGDRCTPAGEFDICFAFGTDAVETGLDFRKVDSGSVWVTDPSSSYYNTLQSGQGSWSKSEKLWDTYFSTGKYSTFLCFSHNGDGEHAGSASADRGADISIRGVKGQLSAGYGDLDISAEDMTALLRWLRKDCKPVIIIR